MKYVTYKNNQAFLKHVQEHLDWAKTQNQDGILTSFMGNLQEIQKAIHNHYDYINKQEGRSFTPYNPNPQPPAQ